MRATAEECQNRISAIYQEYREVVFPLVAFLEVVDSEFPVEILNEIRSIFTHFARVYDDASDIANVIFRAFKG